MNEHYLRALSAAIVREMSFRWPCCGRKTYRKARYQRACTRRYKRVMDVRGRIADNIRSVCERATEDQVLHVVDITRDVLKQMHK